MAAQRVLFVGNSLTYFHGGVGEHVLQLRRTATSAGEDDGALQVESFTQGGASFKRLWQKTKAKHAIKGGNGSLFDIVVLQEDLPETNLEAFLSFGRKFIELVRSTEAGEATPVLYMTWAYERLADTTDEDIENAHRHLAKELQVDVAPVSLARRRASHTHPEVNLWEDDMEHPSLAGTYLSACVVYATIFRKSPLGIAYVPEGLAPEEAKALQEVAASVTPPADNSWHFASP